MRHQPDKAMEWLVKTTSDGELWPSQAGSDQNRMAGRWNSTTFPAVQEANRVIASPRSRTTVVLLLMAALLSQGCAGPTARLQYLVGDPQSLSHYEDVATSIEYPIEEEPHQTAPELFHKPRSIRDMSKVKHRLVTLDECVRSALARSAILTDDGSFLSPANPLLANPSRVTSVYDTAIQETSFLFGNRGPEAALADFDALFTNSIQWGRSEDPQNSPFFNLNAGQTLTDETAQWSSRIEKPLANSGTFSVQHDWNYSQNNVSNRLFPSAYTGFVQAEYRQPLLAGSGTEFTRIAGPIGQNLRGVSGVSQGVLISRINSDISTIDFEQNVMTVVRDVENRYWDLYLALRLYDSEIETFKDLLNFWNQLNLRRESDTPAGPREQARARIYEADARIKGSLADILDHEARLRRLMGLPLSDGEFLTPSEHPSEARLQVDWQKTLTDALAHRPELRRQKWEIKSLELQLKASENLARPRLDLVSQYRVNGFGDQLFGNEDDDGITDIGYHSAYESITQGFNTTWNLGLSFSMPIGLRLARAQIRNYELRLAKSRAVLSRQEADIAYELNTSLLNMDRWYELAESSTKRIEAAVSAHEAFEARLNSRSRDYSQLGQVLDAKINRRDAEQSYLRSIVEYNKGLVDLEFRKGTTLASHAISLAEGEWNPKAYEDARRRGEAISHGLENTKLQTEPMEFVAGPAPSAWEAQGNANRPHVAGMTTESTNGAMQVPPVPENAPLRSIPESKVFEPDAGVPVEPAPQFRNEPTPMPRIVPDPDSQLELPLPQEPVIPNPSNDRVTRLPPETATRIGWVGAKKARKPGRAIPLGAIPVERSNP
ncbi:MAG: TolC family protein [Planctomycetaceae bacterium]|nr:TolC family protein [Planctomycetaceae bacterium]